MRAQRREDDTVAIWKLDRFSRQTFELLLDGLPSAA
jgi:hypothetical protein